MNINLNGLFQNGSAIRVLILLSFVVWIPVSLSEELNHSDKSGFQRNAELHDGKNQAMEPNSRADGPPECHSNGLSVENSAHKTEDAGIQDTAKLREAMPPQLEIISPKNGYTIKDFPIFVEVKIKNFELRTPTMYFGKPNPKAIGHIHYFLDDYPEVATDSTQLLFGKMEGNKYLRTGEHTIAVELVHDNHEVLSPRVWQRVRFNFEH
jgi:hypothetical protein